MGLMGCQYDREKLDQWQEVVDSRDHVRKKKSSTGVHIFFFITILISQIISGGEQIMDLCKSSSNQSQFI